MYRWSNKEPGREQPPPTAELCDLVAYCAAAARVNRGNFVWSGWNPVLDRRKKMKGGGSCVCNGSNLIAVAAKGAR
eukprot:10115574-Alexandrium_andersonii.AAC.1